MAAKMRKSRKKKNENALWFVIIFLIILIASMFLGYYFTHKTDNNNKIVKHIISGISKKEKPLKPTAKNQIEGTWVSNYDGAMMEIHGSRFTLEIPSVNSSSIIKGKITFNGQSVSLVYTSGSQICKGIEGKYHYTLKDKNLIFKIIQDRCAGRSERMSAPWDFLSN